MSTQPSLSTQNAYERHWPNQSFQKWLKKQTSLLISQIIVLLAFPSTIFALAYYLLNNHAFIGLTPHAIENALIVLHLPFLILFVIKLNLIIDQNEIGQYRSNMVYKRVFKGRMNTKQIAANLESSKRIVRKFKIYFLYFLFSLLALYTVFAINTFSHEDNSVGVSKEYIPMMLTADTIGHQFLEKVCPVRVKSTVDSTRHKFTQMVSPDTVKLDSTIILVKENFFSTRDRWGALMHIGDHLSAFCMNTASTLFIFLCFTLLFLPPYDEENEKKHKVILRFSIIGVLVLIFSLPIFVLAGVGIESTYTNNILVGYVTFYNAISGVLNALALALLIGRLDSKLIGLPSHWVSVLYVYAAVQPLFVVFALPLFVNEVIKTAVFAIVFIFKTYFFLIIIYTLQTGRLLNYFFCFPNLNKLVDSIFQNQFEITFNKEHSHKFSFVITEEETIAYSSDLIFDQRKSGLNTVKQLRRRMKTTDSYRVKKSDGTYWIEVVDGEHTVYCNSKNLKTREEAEELILSSIDKIPYCKLNYT